LLARPWPWFPAAARLGVPVAVFAASLQLMLLRFLVPTPVGMADNGDGARLICQLDVGGGWPRFSHVIFRYPDHPSCGLAYPSTQLWLDRLAKWLGGVFGGGGLNLVDLGLLCSVVASAAITVLTFAFPRAGLRSRLVLVGLLWLVVADSAFFGYFASVYSEAAALLGFPLLAAGMLVLHRPGWRMVAGAALVVLGGVLAAGAKVQTLVIVLPLATALLAWRPALRGRYAFAVRCAVPLVLTAAVGSGALLVQAQGDAFGSSLRPINAYNTIFNGILDGEHDTEGDLAALGLPRHAERYAGRTWWEEPTAASDDPAYGDYRDKITMGNVARFYATHPARTLQILQKGARDTLTGRVSYLGSYGVGGEPGRLEYRVPVFSSLLLALAPLGLFLLVPLWGAIGWLGVRAIRRRGVYEVGLVVLFLLAASVTQFFVSALAEGHEGVKHQVLTLYCLLLAAVLAGVSAFVHRTPLASPAGVDEQRSVVTSRA
jgi:hypothetical protein